MISEADRLDAFYEPQKNPDPVRNTRPSMATCHQYFYIPSAKVGDEQECVTRPGAFFRLGGYSDVEEQAATTLGDTSGYYPAEHLKDAPGDKAYKQAAGAQSEDSNGIALACDGRILVKADERIYIYATDLIDIHSGHKIRQHTDTGPIHHHAAADYCITATDNIRLRSGVHEDEPYVAPPENTAGDQGIEIIAKSGSKDIYVEAKSMYTNILGDETEDVDGFKKTIVRASSFNDTWGTKTSIFRGFEVSLNFSLSASFKMNMSLNLTPSYSFDFKFGGFSITYSSASKTFKSIKIGEVKVEANGAVTELSALVAKVETIHTEATAMAAVVAQNMVKNAAIQSEIGTMKSSIMSATNIQL